MQLRPYQREAVDSLFSYFETHKGNPLVVIPTGGGKAFVIAAFIKEAIEKYPDTRIINVTHVKELVGQNHDEMKSIWPEAPTGIYSAGLNRRDVDAQVLFCGIQSVHKRAYEIQRCELLIVDECHLIPTRSNTMYQNFIRELTAINPYLKVIGFTATPFRTDSGGMEGGGLFTDTAYSIGMDRLIEDGYLAPVVGKRTLTKLDLMNVRTVGGDYVQKDLEKAVDRESVNEEAVEEIITYAQHDGRVSWMIFCTGKKHTKHICDILRSKGVATCSITDDTPAGERDRLISEFKAGVYTAIVGVNVLTTGFNAPAVDLIALLRPTKSPALYVQMVGRGTRIFPDKTNCLVLDFGRNIERHGPVDRVEVLPKRKGRRGKQEAPTKICDKCSTILPAGSGECKECGYKFPVERTEPNIEREAARLELLSKLTKKKKPVWHDVVGVEYHLHEKPEGIPSMRVDYQTAGNLGKVVKEWVCVQHEGFARQKAVRWWFNRTDKGAPPATAIEAVNVAAKSLKTPKKIQVGKDGRFDRIEGVEF